MDMISYHSGSTWPEQPDHPMAFEDGTQAFSFLPRAFVPTFKLIYHTQVYRPGHLVTLRNNVDGWSRDLYGVYLDGAWHFELERERYPAGLQMKFLLDGIAWMDGFDVSLASDHDHFFNDGTVHFPPVPPRHLHEYDNLWSSETNLQQDRVRGDYTSETLYDVIIIGSGMGGGILADALSDMGKRTLVLEAGGLLYPTHITNLPGDWSPLPGQHQAGHFINEHDSGLLFGVQMSFGGRSVFWSGIIPRMHDWELESWPVAIREFLRTTGYPRAETLMRKQRTLGPFQNLIVRRLGERFADYQVENLPRSRHQPNLDENQLQANVLQGSTGVFSTADLLLDSLAYPGASGRDNLRINLNHLVTRLEMDGNRAVAVICQDLIGNVERRYCGRSIVLAAGSLESPKIALRSGLADPNHKIGRGLTDHPAFFSRAYTIPQGTEFAGANHHAKIMLYHKHATPAQHPYNVELLINPKYWDVRLADDDLWQKRIEAEQQTLVQMKFIFDSRLDDENYIRLNGEGQKPRVRVKRNVTGSHLWDEVVGLRNQILEFLQVPVHDPNDYMHYGNEGTVHHAGGTLRMSDDGRGVVDENLKFLAYENLYACDVSVFPHIPAANPSLTLAALALRLAERLEDA